LGLGFSKGLAQRLGELVFLAAGLMAGPVKGFLSMPRPAISFSLIAMSFWLGVGRMLAFRGPITPRAGLTVTMAISGGLERTGIFLVLPPRRLAIPEAA